MTFYGNDQVIAEIFDLTETYNYATYKSNNFLQHISY